MWTLELLPDEDGEAMPPPSNTQAGDSQQSRGRAAAAIKGPWLLTAGEFYVGRKAQTCQIIINNNRVSRQHARITVRPLADDEVSRVGALQTVELTDLGSRFFTHVGDETKALEADVPRVLKAGDVLKFPGARMRLRHQALVLCPSNISQGAKESVRAAAARAGAQLAAKWGPMCTHLLVDKEASGTLKVAMAVVEAKPVVDLRWLTEGVLEKREGKLALPLPDPAQYAAGWTKVLGGVVQLGTPRTQHFKGLRFVFVTQDETEALVRLAGAAAVEHAYRWDEAQQADAQGTLAAGLGASNKKKATTKPPVTVLVDPEQEATRALVEKLARTPGVDAVSSRHAIAKSIFSLRPLRDKDDCAVSAAAAAAPAPAAAAAQEASETTAEPAAASKSKGAKAAGKAKAKAKAAQAVEPEQEPQEQQQEKETAATAAASAAATAEEAAVASPARSTRRSARGTPAPAAAEAAAAAEAEAPGSGGTLPNETPASARASRSRGAAAPASASTPAASTSTRKRGRKAVEAEEAEAEGAGAEAAPASPARRSKRAAKGKGEGEGAQPAPQQQVAVAMEQEAEAEAPASKPPAAAAPRASPPGRGASKRKAPPAPEAEAAADAAAPATPQETPSKRGRRGARGNSSQGSQQQQEDDEASIPAAPAASSSAAPAASSSAPAAAAAASASRPFTIRQPPPPPKPRPASKPLDPAEGWMLAPRAAPAKPVAEESDGEGEGEGAAGGSQSQTPQSEARGRRGGRFQEEEGEGGEEDGPIDGAPVVEERDLLGSVYGRGGSIFTYYWQPPPGEEHGGGGGGGGSLGAGAGGAGQSNGDGRPNFKRFRKNRVRGVTEAEGAAGVPIQPRRRAVVGRDDLIAVLPKESEMELQLRYEDDKEQELKRDVDRLFDEESVGPKRRER